jgi:transposase
VDTLQTTGEVVQMPRKFYPPEFRSHVVALVAQGRSPESLSRELEPSAQTIRHWVEAAKMVENPLPTDKDAQIRELERTVKALQKDKAVLEEEREILKKAAAWFAKETISSPKAGSRS